MNEIKRSLLRKLAKREYWGGRHMSFDNLPKGFPKHLSKDVKKVAKELIKESILLRKPTSYGIEVSLNPKKHKEIVNIIK